MKPYTEVEFKKVKGLIEEHKEKFDKARIGFRREDTTIFQRPVQNHAWLVQHHSLSFPS